MHKLIGVLTGVALLVSPAAKADTLYLGAGTAKCLEVVEAVDTDGSDTLELYSWILGFISASTAFADEAFYDAVDSSDNHSLINGVVESCRSNPTATLGRTVFEFVTRFSS